MVFAPLIVVGVLELSLRISGVGYRPSVTVPCTVRGRASRGDNLYFSRSFFSPLLAREFEPFTFPARKPEGAYRVFVLGASAAQGVPNHAFCFGRLLHVMLDARFPDRDVEVVTAAMAAINSHVVLEIARECARYDPDAFVIYLGNNEVVGPYGPATVFTPALSNLRLIRMGIALRKTRTGQLLVRLMRDGSSERPDRWGGMAMFTGNEIRADDPRLKTVYHHFERNLADICRVATRAGAATVLCTVGTNLRDCPPFASRHRPDLTEDEREQWQRAYDRGVEQEAAGLYAEAISSYLDAAELDDTYANLQYRLGHCYWQEGQHRPARERFRQARDLDGLRFRADTRINETIRAVARGRREWGVLLADVVEALAERSPDGVAGEEFFYEHVHLTFEGAYVAAATVLGQIEALLSGDREAIASLEQCARRLAFNDWSHHQTLHTLVHSFLGKPPFTTQLYHDSRVAMWRQRLDALAENLTSPRLDEIAAEYRAALEQSPDDWRLHWDYGKLLAEDLKQYEAAAARFETVQTLLPHSYTGHDALASVYRAQGSLTAAIDEYEATLAIKPTAGTSHYYLGWCHQQLGRVETAQTHYRHAIRYAPDRVSAYLSLGEQLFKEGKLAEATEVCRAGLAVIPDHALLRCNLGMLLIKTGRREKGAAEVVLALKQDPNSPRIRRVAETLLGPEVVRRALQEFPRGVAP
jgi:tetratricopeptide (TPR) repeat protein